MQKRESARAAQNVDTWKGGRRTEGRARSPARDTARNATRKAAMSASFPRGAVRTCFPVHPFGATTRHYSHMADALRGETTSQKAEYEGERPTTASKQSERLLVPAHF